MRAVIQRVLRAELNIEGKEHSRIGSGLVILLGVQSGDTADEASLLAQKIVRLRIFSDSAGKMNLSLADTGGQAMVVSQFTLFADTRKGNRPSFMDSAGPIEANHLYEFFLSALEKLMGKAPAAGVFGSDMQVALVNDGPVTITIDTRILRKE